MAIEIVLVDDHSIVRQGLNAIISREKDIRVIGEAENGRDAVKLVKDKEPDIAILDISMPILNGLEASRQIRKISPKTKIIILSMHDNHAFIDEVLNLGARAYVLKESAADEVVIAINEVYRGRIFLSPKISTFVVKGYINRDEKTEKQKPTVNLTPREKEILQLIAEGHLNKEIAEQLNLSLKTVLAHRNNMMQKLNIHKQADLVRYAIKEGIAHL